MNFLINDSVIVIKTGEFKKIVDFEKICGVELYYMSDKTAYPLEQLIKIKNFNSKEEFNQVLSEKKENILKIIDFDKLSDKWAEWMRKKLQ